MYARGASERFVRRVDAVGRQKCEDANELSLRSLEQLSRMRNRSLGGWQARSMSSFIIDHGGGDLLSRLIAARARPVPADADAPGCLNTIHCHCLIDRDCLCSAGV